MREGADCFNHPGTDSELLSRTGEGGGGGSGRCEFHPAWCDSFDNLCFPPPVLPSACPQIAFPTADYPLSPTFSFDARSFIRIPERNRIERDNVICTYVHTHHVSLFFLSAHKFALFCKMYHCVNLLETPSSIYSGKYAYR